MTTEEISQLKSGMVIENNLLGEKATLIEQIGEIKAWAVQFIVFDCKVDDVLFIEDLKDWSICND